MLPPTRPTLLAGQAVMFLGDHTSPDAPGYLRIVRDVLARFQPQLTITLISAGSDRQTAGGLASRALLDILTSSRPDWVSISVGLAEAAREPELAALISDYRARRDAADREADPVIGVEHSTGPRRNEIVGNGPESGPPQRTPPSLAAFTNSVDVALEHLLSAGVRPILHTPILVGDDMNYPLNLALRAYGKAIREVAERTSVTVIDDERSFRAVLDRATTYKQRVSLADWTGKLNPQGEALMARTFLAAFGLLPGMQRGGA